jgi:D-alanyl-D-alanine carboxypeptidase
MLGLAVVLAACSSGSGAVTTAEGQPTTPIIGQQAPPTASLPTILVATTAAPPAKLEDFPEFPEATLSETVAASLQAVLDGAVEQGTIPGVTAAVIVGDSGSWSGAAGVDAEGGPLTPDTRLLTASSGKTVTAAQVLRLADEGKLGLDDPATEHFPPDIAFYDANGATIRDVLGMRSGIPDPPGYEALVDSGTTTAELLEKIPGPLFPAGSRIAYANINYVLLGMIIEQVTARPLWEALRSGVLDRPGLEGLVYLQKDALAADGWRIESDPASLARWGYDLYGGFVLSDAALGQMTDFQGDWYGLGAIDLSQGTPAIPGGYGVPAIGHGGLSQEPSQAVMLVAFPETDVVVAVQVRVESTPRAATLAGDLRNAAQP